MGHLDRSLRLALVIVPCLVGCGDNQHSDSADASVTADATPDAGPRAVTLRFAAKVGGTAFACGQTYPNIGTSAASYVASDFRFYVHDVKLVGPGGPVPVTLDANEWQNATGVALLDFENATNDCQMGSTATHEAVTGTAPAGTYTGIEFKVGVPFDLNHLDATTATAPLNIPAMYWAWASGHRFAKIDGVVGGKGFNLHLGSTGCASANPMAPPATACANPNVMALSFPTFNVETGTITVDPAAVLADVDVTTNTENTAPGCMSFPGDPECTTVFPHLGLAYGAAPAGPQVLFVAR